MKTALILALTTISAIAQSSPPFGSPTPVPQKVKIVGTVDYIDVKNGWLEISCDKTKSIGKKKAAGYIVLCDYPNAVNIGTGRKISVDAYPLGHAVNFKGMDMQPGYTMKEPVKTSIFDKPSPPQK